MTFFKIGHQPDKIDDDVKNFPLLLGVCHVEQEDVMALRSLFRLIRKTLINIKHKYVFSESLECV